MNNGSRFVMARIDLPILLRNDGSYDAMNERAKVSFFGIDTLPEINTQTQISLGDLFSQMGETQSQHVHQKTEIPNTRIRIDETTPTSMDLSWFRSIEKANTDADANKGGEKDEDEDEDEEDGSHSEIYEDNDDNTAIVGGSSPISMDENDVNNTSPEQPPEKPHNSENIPFVSGSENEPEHDIPVMRIMLSEIKQRKAPRQGKTFKKYEKGVCNFTQKKYG